MLSARAAVVALIVAAAPASAGMPISATPDRTVQTTAENPCVRIGLNVLIPELGTCTNESGAFGIGKLGPYEWPVHFSANGYAQAWYGGTLSRSGSTMVDLRTRHEVVTMTLKPEGCPRSPATRRR